MSADSVSPTPARSRRRVVRLIWAGGIALAIVGVPVGALAAGAFGPSHGRATANAAQSGARLQVGSKSTVHLGNAADPGQDYYGYVALAGPGAVARIDVNTDTILSESISADTAEGVAVTPDDSQVFVAETGQYDVVAVNTSTDKETPVEVGPYPQDVAVSPDGSQVYATVTGGDTGPGGSDVVAVLSTATDKVTGDIKVGAGPRQVVFSPDGSRAYVTTETGIAIVDTSTETVIGRIRDRAGPQGLAISPDGSTLYVTNPSLNSVWVISTSSDTVTGSVSVGAEPQAVAVTPDGSQAYVADMDADAVSVISTSTDTVTATVSVGRLPGSIAVTPDGSQVWVGNILTGDITVINPATNTVAGTIDGGLGTATLDDQPLGMAFVKAP
jgi:YVTN family beta-propeller protein